jgi:H+-translocating NAD(P) transhydrogenase subunit alpha
MKIVVPKEAGPGERRVALVPESAARLKALGADIAVEAGAGPPPATPTPPMKRRALR